MNVGFLSINRNECDETSAAKILFDKGHSGLFLFINSGEELNSALDYLRASCNVLVICGDTRVFLDTLSDKYDVDNKTVFEHNGKVYAVSDKCTADFVADIVIPILNEKSKVYYNAAIFKTIGVPESQLRETLKDLSRKRSSIVFGYFRNEPECEVHVRYSSKMPKASIDELLATVTKRLKDFTYAYSDISLCECVAAMIREQKLKLKIAESFTGGAIASAFVHIPGASNFLSEAVVTYTNNSKTERLGVSADMLSNDGAVSHRVVCDMIKGLIVSDDCNLAIATTGNAGPTSEKANEVGKCFIAVADDNEIHVCEYNFKGDREQVIHCGTQFALFRMYQLLLKKRDKLKQSIKNQE